MKPTPTTTPTLGTTLKYAGTTYEVSGIWTEHTTEGQPELTIKATVPEPERRVGIFPR